MRQMLYRTGKKVPVDGINVQIGKKQETDTIYCQDKQMEERRNKTRKKLQYTEQGRKRIQILLNRKEATWPGHNIA